MAPSTPAPPGTARVAANPPARPRAAVATDTVKRTIPGSARAFTVPEIRDAYGPADWFPDDHPAMLAAA